MEALLVRDLRLREEPFREICPSSKVSCVSETYRICKKADLPGIPPDGLVLQDAHMRMQVDGAVYDLVNKSLLVRVKSESFKNKDELQSALTAYQVLGWSLFPEEG